MHSVTGLIVSGVALLALLVIRYHSSNGIPSHVPWAGAENPGILTKARLYLRSILRSHDMLKEGYDKYSKNGSAFVFANLFTGPEILLPIEHMDWIHDQPEKELSSFEAHREFMRADWTFLHPTIFHEHVFASAIKVQLTRHLDVLTPDMADEAMHALQAQQSQDPTEWFELSDHASWKKLVLQVVSRIYVGEPLCRDKEYLRDATTFNEFSMLTAAIIGMFPAFLRPVLAPLVVLRDKYYHERCAMKTKPVIQRRIELIDLCNAGKAEYATIPNNLITWSIEDAQASEEAHKYKQSLDFLAARISMMNFVSIDSTSITIENVLWDVLDSPLDIPSGTHLPPGVPEPTLLDYLRAEARAAFATYRDQPAAWKNIINSLPLLDACLKESFRLNNFISRTNVRKIMAKDGIDVPGVGRVAQGVKIAFSLWGAHHDEEAYGDASRWRMSRWLDDEKRERMSVFGSGSSGTQYLPFGYRRHACPGRFFALRIVKIILVHLLLYFEIEMMSETKPGNPWLGVSRGPPMGGRLRFRRKSCWVS